MNHYPDCQAGGLPCACSAKARRERIATAIYPFVASATYTPATLREFEAMGDRLPRHLARLAAGFADALIAELDAEPSA